MAELQQKDTEWKGKLGRPNFKDIGLNVRALQNAGVIEHNIECFAPVGNDPHAEFRECLRTHDFAREKTNSYKSTFDGSDLFLRSSSTLMI